MSAGNLSQVQIMNMSVDLLHDAPLTGMSDDTAIARKLKRNFPIVRDQLLRMHPWNFATVRQRIAASTLEPEFGWTYGYPLPSGCLRIYDLQRDPYFEGRTIPYALENDGTDHMAIMTNEAAPLYLRYCRRVEATGLFDPLFCAALAAKLAVAIAHSTTGKASMLDRCRQAYDDAIAEAQRTDALEGTPERPESSDWDDARNVAWW